MRKPIIAGNWKMNKTPEEAKELVSALIPLVKDADCDVVVCVPAADYTVVAETIKGTNIKLYVSTFYQEGGSPEFDEGVKNYINSNADAKASNGGDDTISAVTAMGYDAYYVALEAIKAAGSPDAAKIKAALPTVTYTGVSGSISFDAIGDAVRDTAFIKTADTANGAWVLEKVQTGSAS